MEMKPINEKADTADNDSHPYISSTVLLFGAFIVVEQCLLLRKHLLTPPLFVSFSLELFLIFLFFIRPKIGSRLESVLISIEQLAPFPTPSSSLLMLLYASFVNSYFSAKKGLLLGIIAILCTCISGFLFPFSVMGKGGCLSFSLLIALFVCCGTIFKIWKAKEVHSHDEAFTQYNLTIARYLHDHIANNLSAIILATESKDSMQQTDLDTVQKMATAALFQTREAIRALEYVEKSESKAFTFVHHSSNSSATEELEEFIKEHQELLHALGFDGQIFFSNSDSSTLTEAETPFIRNLLTELFGNIVKHSNADDRYYMIISIDDQNCYIEMTDSPSQDKTGVVNNGSGLSYYQKKILEMKGSFHINSKKHSWSICISLPLNGRWTHSYFFPQNH